MATTLVILVIITVEIVILKLVNKVFNKSNNVSLKFIKSIIDIISMIIVVYMILSMFDLTRDLSKTLLQSSTLIIAILTFTAQKTLSNFISGIGIVFSKPFEVGHKIAVLSGNSILVEGYIVGISVRQTEIRQYDGKICIVPNSIMDNSVIVNSNYLGDIGYAFEIEVSYNSNIDKAKEILKELIENEELTIKDKEVTVLTSRITQNGLIIKSTIWTKTLDDSFITCSNIREKIVKQFRDNNIVIPYNTITIDKYIDKEIIK